MAIVLALVAAFVYGVSDYAGGRASRRASPLVVSLIAEISIFAVLIVVVPLTSTSSPGGDDLAWGAAAGAAGTVGIIALYYALANGAMTVVAPITGVVSAVVPVGVGLATGERPSVLALVGVSIAIVSVALIGGLVGVPHVRTPAVAGDGRVALGRVVRTAVRVLRPGRRRQWDVADPRVRAWRRGRSS